MRLKPKRNKYNAVATMRDGMRFDSKAEAAYYDRLKMLKLAGEVKYFLRQVPFHLPGGVRYVCDFVVHYSDGSIEYVDIKGVETAMFKTKKKLVEACYPVEINVVKK